MRLLSQRMLSRGELENVAEDFEKLELEKMGAGTHERLHAKMTSLLEDVHTVI